MIAATCVPPKFCQSCGNEMNLGAKGTLLFNKCKTIKCRCGMAYRWMDFQGLKIALDETMKIYGFAKPELPTFYQAGGG